MATNYNLCSSWSPPDEDGESFIQSLEEACQAGDVERTHQVYSRWLSDQHPDSKTGLLPAGRLRPAAHRAVTNNQPACLAYLCQQRLKINDNIVSAALYAAVETQSAACLGVLLDHGWDINRPTSWHEPPLMGYVVQNETLVRWFLDHGASPNALAGPPEITPMTCHDVKAFDITPLSRAVQRSSFDVIKLMFQYGGSTIYGQLLNMASDRTDPDSVPILQFLFDHGDKRINSTYLEDRPDLDPWHALDNAAPLHHAARVGNIDTVQWLLQHGADPTRRTKRVVGYGTTPLDSARHTNHTEIAKLLEKAIANSLNFTAREDLPSDPDATAFYHKATRTSPETPPTGPRVDINHGNGPGAPGQNYAQQDYSMYLMLREMENKKRRLLEKENQDVVADEIPKDAPPKTAREMEADKQMQALLEDAQRKKLRLMSRKETEISIGQPGVDHATNDGARETEEHHQATHNTEQISEDVVANEQNAAAPSGDPSEQPSKPGFWARFGWR
ncbi:MAG: hypothetical protein Q9168_002286 [Polycauliona sp. 1 TL-2023]